MLSAPETRTRNRAEITDAYKWRLDDIYPDWATWETALAELEGGLVTSPDSRARWPTDRNGCWPPTS